MALLGTPTLSNSLSISFLGSFSNWHKYRKKLVSTFELTLKENEDFLKRKKLKYMKTVAKALIPRSKRYIQYLINNHAYSCEGIRLDIMHLKNCLQYLP